MYRAFRSPGNSRSATVPESGCADLLTTGSDMPSVPTAQRLAAESLGTFGLVFLGCGAAVLTADFVTPDGLHLGIGFLGVAMAFGLTVLVLAATVGHISGGHFNPAVTVGLAVAGRFAWRDVPAYVVTQACSAVAAAAVLYAIAAGRAGFDPVASGFASNGYGNRSPGGYSVWAALLAEILMTAMFLLVILGVTDERARPGIAPAAIGLCLLVIHLVTIPVTNTSVNPARSLGPALFAGRHAIGQLWLFLVAPTVGAILAGLAYPRVFGSGPAPAVQSRNTRRR
jgi:aquaporin Z